MCRCGIAAGKWFRRRNDGDAHPALMQMTRTYVRVAAIISRAREHDGASIAPGEHREGDIGGCRARAFHQRFVRLPPFDVAYRGDGQDRQQRGVVIVVHGVGEMASTNGALRCTCCRGLAFGEV